MHRPDGAGMSMEYGITDALPLYSGGLGILAGDHLKTASDLGVPLVAVGLFYREGYFRQMLDTDGAQLEIYAVNSRESLPVRLVTDTEGMPLRVTIELPGQRKGLVWAVFPCGRIERESDGPPQGTLHEGAAKIVERALPPFTQARWEEALLAGQGKPRSIRIGEWKLHVEGTPPPGFERLGADWVDPRRPNDTTLLAQDEQYKPTDLPSARARRVGPR